jgi:hypothetical protein
MQLLGWLRFACGSVRPGHVLHEGKGAKSMTIKLAEGSGVRQVRAGFSGQSNRFFFLQMKNKKLVATG